MALSLRQIRNKINTVENIGKITGAMEMVSIAKLRPLAQQFSLAKEYFLQLERMLNNLLTSFPEASQELLKAKPKKESILLCLVSSDSGLCGTYNSAIIQTAEQFIDNNKAKEINLLIIGRKGLSRFKKSGYPVINSYTEIYGHYSWPLADKITKDLTQSFLSGQADEVFIAYTNFVSTARYAPVVEKLLNIEPGQGKYLDYLLEPDIATVLDDLVPFYLRSRVAEIILSAFTAENSTRAIAMRKATENVKELSEDLLLLRNKMRQADITREIIEIISSADALKG